MRPYKAEAVVLRAIDCGNGDKLLSLYSKEHGKIRVMAHGAAKPYSRKRGATLPFSHSRFLISKGKELDSISQGELVEIFPHLRDDLEHIARASYLVELVDAFTPDGEPSTRLFNLLLTVMHLFTAGDGDLLIRYFEMGIVTLQGYRPFLEQCVNCHASLTGEIYFSPDLGGVLCANCRQAGRQVLPLQRGALENMKLFLTWPPEKLQRLKLSPAARKQIKSLQQEYIRFILEKELKSAAFINTMQKSNLMYEK